MNLIDFKNKAQWIGVLINTVMYEGRNLQKNRPGVICGAFRRVTATQMTRTPTQMTMMVAVAGTTISRLSHSGIPGMPPPAVPLVRSSFSSEPASPPKAGPTRSEKWGEWHQGWITWLEPWGRRLSSSENANDGDRDDNDGHGRHDGHNQVDVGQKVLQSVLQLVVPVHILLGGIFAVPGDTPCWSYRTYIREHKIKLYCIYSAPENARNEKKALQLRESPNPRAYKTMGM